MNANNEAMRTGPEGRTCPDLSETCPPSQRRIAAPLPFVEEWAPVPGHDGYEASSLGRIRSIDRTVETRQGPRKRRGQVLTPHQHKGYLLVSLGRRWRGPVHHLVLLAFAGPRPEGHEGRHLDGNPLHNAAHNLAWGSHSDNEQDKRRNGTYPLGAANNAAKLTPDDVRHIDNAVRRGRRRLQLARDLGVSRSTIDNVVNRARWRHIAYGASDAT